MRTAMLETLMTGGRYTGRQLSVILKTNGATVRRIINGLRSDGVPICSDRKGYYMTTDADEIRKTIMSIEHRISQMTKAVDGLKRGLGE